MNKTGTHMNTPADPEKSSLHGEKKKSNRFSPKGHQEYQHTDS